MRYCISLVLLLSGMYWAHAQKNNLNSLIVINPSKNTFHLTRKGEAILVNGKRIEGLFFYSSPLFADDFFFFYPSGIQSREKLLITEVAEITFTSSHNENYRYKLNRKHLERKLSDESQEVLTTKVLIRIDQSSQANKE